MPSGRGQVSIIGVIWECPLIEVPLAILIADKPWILIFTEYLSIQYSYSCMQTVSMYKLIALQQKRGE